MVAALFEVQNLLFPWEIPLFPIEFWNVQWAISSLVPWRLVAHIVRTGLIWSKFALQMYVTTCSTLEIVCDLQNNCLPPDAVNPDQGIIKGMGFIFEPCVNAVGWRPSWRSRMVVSYCTCGFGAVIQRDLRKVSLLRIWAHNNLNKGNTCLTIMLSWLSYEKIQKYNSLPYVMARLLWSLCPAALYCLTPNYLFLRVICDI